MRPDEHKKKKSAQYRKLHGNDQKLEKTAGIERKPVSDCSATVPTANNQPLNTSISKEEPVQQKSFRRRPLESNWSKYEESQVEESSSRGADFLSLLSSSKDVLSHFQFEDEKGWGCSDADFSVQSSHLCDDIFVLNSEELAASLMCLPLHQRLNIEENAFEKQHIDSFVLDAERQKSLYKSKMSSSSVVSIRDAEVIKSNAKDGFNIPESKSTEMQDLLEDLLAGSATDNSLRDIRIREQIVSSPFMSQKSKNFLGNSDAELSNSCFAPSEAVSDIKLELLRNVVQDSDKNLTSDNSLQITFNQSEKMTKKTEHMEKLDPRLSVKNDGQTLKDDFDFLLSLKNHNKESTVVSTIATTADDDDDSWLDNI